MDWEINAFIPLPFPFQFELPDKTIYIIAASERFQWNFWTRKFVWVTYLHIRHQIDYTWTFHRSGILYFIQIFKKILCLCCYIESPDIVVCTFFIHIKTYMYICSSTRLLLLRTKSSTWRSSLPRSMMKPAHLASQFAMASMRHHVTTTLLTKKLCTSTTEEIATKLPVSLKIKKPGTKILDFQKWIHRLSFANFSKLVSANIVSSCVCVRRVIICNYRAVMSTQGSSCMTCGNFVSV